MSILNTFLWLNYKYIYVYFKNLSDVIDLRNRFKNSKSDNLVSIVNNKFNIIRLMYSIQLPSTNSNLDSSNFAHVTGRLDIPVMLLFKRVSLP